MEIIIVRHGLSEGNVKRIASGRINVNLTEEGKKQAQALADRLQDLEIECIYSSPLKRTMETALPIAERKNIPIEVDHRIIEVDFGRFDGKPEDEMAEITGKDGRGWLNTYQYDFSDGGGENHKDVEKRVRAFVEDLKKQPYKLVLIVTHGGIIRMLHYVITGEKIGPTPNAEELFLKT